MWVISFYSPLRIFFFLCIAVILSIFYVIFLLIFYADKRKNQFFYFYSLFSFFFLVDWCALLMFRFTMWIVNNSLHQCWRKEIITILWPESMFLCCTGEFESLLIDYRRLTNIRCVRSFYFLFSKWRWPVYWIGFQI